MFKLKAGDVCRLKEIIPGIYKSNDWKTGLYRVIRIYAPFVSSERDRSDPRCQSYFFEKIRKDGTAYKSFSNGYRCLSWDKFIEEGKVEILAE